MTNLSELKPSSGSVKGRKRLGRGPGSGKGKTSGKGHKGQKSRSGYNHKPWKEGGQMPLQRRLPKRGFTNIFKKEYQEVTLAKLSELGIENITPENLLEKRVINKKNIPIKVLGNGDIEKSITVSAHAFSKTAVEKIEKAGGKIDVIGKKSVKSPRKKNQKASKAGGGEEIEKG